MKMKVDLKKKRALAAAVLFSMSCYGQAWAVDSEIETNDNGKNLMVTIREQQIYDMISPYIKNNNGTYGFVAGDVSIPESITWIADNNDPEGYAVNNTLLKSIGQTGGETNIVAQKDIVINGDIQNNVDVGAGYNPRDLNTNHIININSDGAATVKMTGSMITYNEVNDFTNNGDGNCTNIKFSNSEAYLVGYVWDYITGNAVNNTKTRGTTLEFSNGAKWDVTYGSMLACLKVTEGASVDFTNSDDYVFLNVQKSFDGAGGIIEMRFDGSKKVTFDEFGNSNSDENYGDFLIIEGTHEGVTNLLLTNVVDDDTNIKGRVLARVKNEQGSFKSAKAEGALSWVNYELAGEKVNYYANMDTTRLEEWTDWKIIGINNCTNPTTSVNTLLSTITAGYDTWRNDTDKFNERMGELRLNGVGNEGVWVRTKGSEFGRRSSNGSYTNKQQTYQLGYDAVTSKDDKQTTYTGVAAEYGKGSLSFDSGTGTMKSMGLGVYQTKMYESGHYLDLVGRFDKYKNDFHVADTQGNAINGKYGNNALSMSAEYGRKNELKHGWYIEPQSEVTLGYMFGNDFTTSNNIRVEQKNMPALIGRLGLNIGREVSDKVNFYVKASINHDFLGNYDMQMTDLKSGERLGASDRFGSSWFDYGAGLSVKTGKDSYAYFDIERAVGGEYKKNWDWNAGVRWSF